MSRPAVDRAAIRAAAARIAPYVRRTPVIELQQRDSGAPWPLVLKLEHMQETGSFKVRGAFNRMLSHEIGEAGVIAASGGNHGAAVAFAARALGVRAEIFVPTIASPVKIQRLREYGADVTVTGADYAEAFAASTGRATASGALVVHAYDQLDVLAGQGTVALELEEQAEHLDTLLVAVGGGGLIGGCAAWFEGRIRLVAVEPVGCPTYAAARQAGHPVPVEVGGVAADSLGAAQVGELMFAYSEFDIARSVLVEDDDILAAQAALWAELRIVAEPGGATALAALLSGAYVPEAAERVGILVCGGNADLSRLI